MDSYSYGSMVEHGGYATGGVILTGTTEASSVWANLAMRLTIEGQIQLPGAHDLDDGCAGVPAKV